MDPFYKYIEVKSTSAINLIFYYMQLFIIIIKYRAFLHYRSNIYLDLDIYLL